jgi:hypothetical protein
MGTSARPRRTQPGVRARHFALAAVLALLTTALFVPAAPAHPAPELSGVWVLSPTPDGSKYALFTSADRTTLTANWMGGPGPHAGLVGSFQGTRDASGTHYTGPLHITEGSTDVTGTMTWTVDALNLRFHEPTLDVTYQQSNGVGGSFHLQILLLPGHIDPSSIDTIKEQVDCPDPTPCGGRAAALGAGGAASPFRPATSAAAQTVFGVLPKFTVQPGHSATIKIHLNKAGKKRLAKRGSLKVKVVITITKGTGLPHTIDGGIVTFHKK